jgi:hypothetical protein
MIASRGMGAISPSKMPKGKKIIRKDNPNVVEEYAKGGSTNWISGAIKKPGALHKQLGVPMNKPIPSGKLAKASMKPGKLGKRARLAQTLKGFSK